MITARLQGTWSKLAGSTAPPSLSEMTARTICKGAATKEPAKASKSMERMAVLASILLAGNLLEGAILTEETILQWLPRNC